MFAAAASVQKKTSAPRSTCDSAAGLLALATHVVNVTQNIFTACLFLHRRVACVHFSAVVDGRAAKICTTEFCLNVDCTVLQIYLVQRFGAKAIAQ